MKTDNFKKILLYLIIFFQLTPVLAEKNKEVQKIRGVYAFPIDEHQIKTRINVNPNVLAANEKSIEKIMKKITVIACVEGECKFADSNPGLGFFEAKFKFPHLKKGKYFDMLVVACSELGCDKNSLNVRVTYPDGKAATASD